jgi:hypothetical protein
MVARQLSVANFVDCPPGVFDHQGLRVSGRSFERRQGRFVTGVAKGDAHIPQEATPLGAH